MNWTGAITNSTNLVRQHGTRCSTLCMLTFGGLHWIGYKCCLLFGVFKVLMTLKKFRQMSPIVCHSVCLPACESVNSYQIWQGHCLSYESALCVDLVAHRGLAEEKNQCWIISTTKQAISMSVKFCFTLPWLWKRFYMAWPTCLLYHCKETCMAVVLLSLKWDICAPMKRSST